MFLQVYKSTIKNLLRSVLFFFVLGIFLFVSLYSEIFDTTTNMHYIGFLKFIANLSLPMLRYPLAILIIVSVVIILNHDQEDDFFEIEKAAGLRPSNYIFSKLAAIISINFIVITIAVFIRFGIRVFRAKGIDFVGWEYCLIDSTVRIFRHLIFIVLPYILFFVGTTYLIGTLCKSGVAAGITGTTYAALYFIIDRIFEVYFITYLDYFSPMPMKLFWYMYYYDFVDFEASLIQHNTSFEKAAFCFIFLSGIGIISAVLSYLYTKRRTI